MGASLLALAKSIYYNLKYKMEETYCIVDKRKTLCVVLSGYRSR